MSSTSYFTEQLNSLFVLVTDEPIGALRFVFVCVQKTENVIDGTLY